MQTRKLGIDQSIIFLGFCLSSRKSLDVKVLFLGGILIVLIKVQLRIVKLIRYKLSKFSGVCAKANLGNFLKLLSHLYRDSCSRLLTPKIVFSFKKKITCRFLSKFNSQKINPAYLIVTYKETDT